ncbi:DDE_3 domain-containing protein [Trichonephila clavipes]|nr:DDE_3 domain-containing protein [Trichonephila clavipes]
MNPGLFWGQMTTMYGCGGTLVSGTIPPTVLRHTARTAGVMVWGAIAYDSRSTLIVMRGTVTGQLYVDDILRSYIGPFLNGLSGAILQQDNARPLTAIVAQDFLGHVQTLPWPPLSPDLSPVEHVWDPLKRQMPSCHSVHHSELAVQDLGVISESDLLTTPDAEILDGFSDQGVIQLPQTYAQATKPSPISVTTQTYENISKIKCSPLNLLPPLSSPTKPNISMFSPAASKLSSSKTQLLPSIFSIGPTVSHPQLPTLVSDTKEQPSQAHGPRKDSKKTDLKKIKPTTNLKVTS